MVYGYETNENGLIAHASTEELKLKEHEGRLHHDKIHMIKMIMIMRDIFLETDLVVLQN